MNIINLPEEAIIRLAEASTRAMSEGRTLRVAIDGSGFKFKVGEGMWTPGYKEEENNGTDR